MTTPTPAVLDRVDGDRMTATVAMLAADRFAGRRVGTPGGAAARAWLGQRLADLGADVTFAPFPVRSVPDVYTTPTVRWHDGRTVHELGFARDVAMHLASAETPLVRKAGLVVAGGGDPTGRWVLVPDGMSLFDAYGHADGAVGLLLGRGVDGYGWQYTMLAGPEPSHLPVLTLAKPLFDGVSAGAVWFAGNAPVRRVDVTAANVHGRFRAAADGGVDLLLTAHYDGVGDLPGIRQPGAADNGSGVAVVLEAARVLVAHLPDGVGLSVALLDAEEVGALGSAHHAATLGTRPLVVNVDGAGHLDEAAAVEAGGPAHGLLALLDQAGRHVGLPLRAAPVASDNRRYGAAGLPAVGIGAGMAGYHSPADTADRVEAATLTAVARLVVATGWLTAAVPDNLSSLIGDKR
jgi:hypothetical protein